MKNVSIVVHGDSDIGRHLVVELLREEGRRVLCVPSKESVGIDEYLVTLRAVASYDAEAFGVREGDETRLELISEACWKRNASSGRLEGIRDGESCQSPEFWFCAELPELAEVLHPAMSKEYLDLLRTAILVATRLNRPQLNYVLPIPFERRRGSADPVEERRAEVVREAEREISRALARGVFCHVRLLTRPILIGSSTNHHPLVASELCSLLSEFAWFDEFVRDRVPDYFANHPLTIQFDQDSVLEVAPVDRFACRAVRAAREGGDAAVSRPMSGSSLVRIDTLADALGDAIPGLRIRTTQDESNLNYLDLALAEKLRRHRKYIHSEPSLGSDQGVGAHEQMPSLSRLELGEYVKSFLSARAASHRHHDLRAETVMASMTKRQVRCRFEHHLEYFRLGQGPAVVLLNAVGASKDVWARIIPFLFPNHTVLTWESRGLGEEADCTDMGESKPFGGDERANDILEVLAHEAIETAHLVGWCSGASDAVRCHAKRPGVVRSMTLIGGIYTDQSDYVTEYNRKLIELAQLLEAQPFVALALIDSLRRSPAIDGGAALDVEGALRKAVESVSPKYRPIVLKAMYQRDTLSKYCAMLLRGGFTQQHEPTECIRAPCLIVSGQHDSVAHSRQADWICKRASPVFKLEIAAATHWMLLENHVELGRALKTFIASVD